MKTFKKFISEMNVAGAGGVFGGGDSFGHGGMVGNFDFYATGDSRIPQVIGTFSRAGKVAKGRKKNKLTNAIKGKSKGQRVGKRAGGLSRKRV
jgi:hypothetical protein